VGDDERRRRRKRRGDVEDGRDAVGGGRRGRWSTPGINLLLPRLLFTVADD